MRLDRLDWRLSVKISVIVRSSIPDQAADPIVDDIHSKITADNTLGGYALDIEPRAVGFEIIEADQPAGVISMNYLIKYRTTVTDLSAG